MARKEWRDTTKVSKFDLFGGIRYLIGWITAIASFIFLILGVVCVIMGNNALNAWDFDATDGYLRAWGICLSAATVFVGSYFITLYLIPKSAKEIFVDHIETVIGLESNIKCGTAIMIREGILATNAHVILDDERNVCEDICCNFIAAKNIAGIARRYAEVIKYDEDLDLAILRIIPKETDSFSKIKKGKVSSLKSGDKIYAVGNSDGNGVAISQGMVSLPLVKEQYEHDGNYYIQMTVATIGGNSGGAILDRRGRLVGMCTFNKKANPNFTYAIPVERIMEYLGE